jgi:hypothetical protein
MSIRTATVTLVSTSPYSQSKHFEIEAEPNEKANDIEKRLWRNRMHVNDKGNVVIPGMQIMLALMGAASYLSEKVKGKGKATYTKHFAGGVTINEVELDTGIKAESVQAEALYVPSDGKPGGNLRVMKYFPRINGWAVTCSFNVFDDAIDTDTFKRHLEAAGIYIGVGRWRPRNRGLYGRFRVEDIKWSK